MISESLGAVWVVNPRLTLDGSLLMISMSLGVLWAVKSTHQL
jgi:hypothetical protein